MSDRVVDDGLTTPEIGYWGKRKYHFLRRYLHMFTKGMRRKWPQLFYIDLFAGAGYAKIRHTGEVVETSSVIASMLEFPFTSLRLCDSDAGNCRAMEQRLARLAPSVHRTIHQGDANKLVGQIIEDIPARNALCVTFADPYGLHLDFETVRKIAELRSDLIVLLADNMDALRNWAVYYYDNPASSLDRFMGEPGWRESLASTHGDKQADALRSRYIERLRTLGFSHFAHERFQNSRGADIYSLVYASRHSRGLDFWHKASEVDEGGQRTLPFEA
jgi:three-Cys-motif partner protein